MCRRWQKTILFSLLFLLGMWGAQPLAASGVDPGEKQAGSEAQQSEEGGKDADAFLLLPDAKEELEDIVVPSETVVPSEEETQDTQEGVQAQKNPDAHAEEENVLPLQGGLFQENGEWYYRDGQGKLVRDHWVEAGEKRYFAGPSGAFYRNCFIHFGPKYYYMGADGSVQTGLISTNGNLYYMDLETGLQDREQHWVHVNGKRYFISASGALYRNRTISFGNTVYYMQADGSPAFEKFIEDQQHLYYFDADGHRVQTNAWVTIAGKEYFPNAEGKIYRDQVISFGDKAYYMNHDGNKSYGRIQGKGGQYYADPATGLLYRNRSVTDGDGNLYYLMANYQMRRGWWQMQRKLYYFDPDATFPAALRGQRRKIGTVTYEFHADGYVVHNAAVDKAFRKLDAIGWDLRRAYDWVVAFSYREMAQEDPAPGLDWFANRGFDQESGNCLVYAASFYEMARLMNYDAHWMFGYVGDHDNPHSWVEIVLDGRTYVFDLSFENGTGRNGYQIYYGKKGTWRYMDYAPFS